MMGGKDKNENPVTEIAVILNDYATCDSDPLPNHGMNNYAAPMINVQDTFLYIAGGHELPSYNVLGTLFPCFI